MDDLLLFIPNKQTHFEKLTDLFLALCKNGLNISPKKCQLFKTELQNMGNTIFIKEKIIDHLAINPHNENQNGTNYQQNKQITKSFKLLLI